MYERLVYAGRTSYKFRELLYEMMYRDMSLIQVAIHVWTGPAKGENNVITLNWNAKIKMHRNANGSTSLVTQWKNQTTFAEYNRISQKK